MRIEIGDRWVLDGDGLNITLREKHVVQAGVKTKPENVGKVNEVVRGYYHTLPGALKALVGTKSLSEEQLNTVERLEAFLSLLYEEIEKIPKELSEAVRAG